MSSSNYRFTLDMQKDQSQISLPVRKGDTDRSLYISLTNGGSPYYIEDGCLALFVGLKPDGKDIANYCPIEKNSVIRYDFTEQTANAEGIVDCEIRLFDSEGKPITSPRFIMVVDLRVVNDNVPLSESEHNIIDYVSAEEAKRQTAENNRNESEATRSANEAVRESSESERHNYEITRLENEDKRIIAELTREEAESRREAAGGERATAEEIRIDNENARIASENERVEAESYRGQKVTELGMYLTESEFTIPTADYVVNELVNKTFDEGTVFVCETGAVTYITYTKEPIKGAIYIDPTSVEWLMGMLTVEPDKAYLVHGANGENAYFKTSGAFVPERNIIKKMEDRCANAIKKKICGEAIRVDDASPNEHFIGCKVRSKNLFNTVDDFRGYDHTYANGTLSLLGQYTNKFILLEDGKTYTFSCHSTRTGETGGGAFLRAYTEDKSAYVNLGSAINILSPTITSTLPKGYPYLRITFYGYYSTDDTDTGDATYTDIMLEEGTEATGYVPYVDATTATVTRYGKNLLDLSRATFSYANYNKDANGITCKISNGYYSGVRVDYLNDFLLANKGKTLTFSIEEAIDDAMISLLIYGTRTSGKTNQEGSTTGKREISFAISEEFTAITGLEVRVNRKTTAFTDTTTVVRNMQVEVSEASTDFEVYKEGTARTPKSDGTIEDIKSVAPTMTLLTDTEGVIIEIEYNQDINVLRDILMEALDAIIEIQKSLIGGTDQ